MRRRGQETTHTCIFARPRDLVPPNLVKTIDIFRMASHQQTSLGQALPIKARTGIILRAIPRDLRIVTLYIANVTTKASGDRTAYLITGGDGQTYGTYQPDIGENALANKLKEVVVSWRLNDRGNRELVKLEVPEPVMTGIGDETIPF